MHPVTLTHAARDRIRSLMPTPEAGLRIGLRKGGCAGMEYTMSVCDHPQENDIEVVEDGAHVLLDPMSQMFLIGLEIDFTTSLLETGFTFRNPNVASSCGCGESVSFSL